MKSTRHDESVIICHEGAATAPEGEDIYVQPGYHPIFTKGVLKAVKNKGNHTLSLGDKNITCSDSKDLYCS